MTILPGSREISRKHHLSVSPGISSSGAILQEDCMNDLQRYFPNNQLSELMDDLTSVNSWDDFARRFLLGDGMSKNTSTSAT